MRKNYPEFGAILKEARLKKHLKQKDCLKGLGDITIQMLSSWENGYVFPSYPYLRKISLFYNLSLDYLILGIKKDKKEFANNYADLFYDLLSILNSKQFNEHFINNFSDDGWCITTTNKIIVDFLKNVERLKSAKDLYGEELYQVKLYELIDSYKSNKIN